MAELENAGRSRGATIVSRSTRPAASITATDSTATGQIAAKMRFCTSSRGSKVRRACSDVISFPGNRSRILSLSQQEREGSLEMSNGYGDRQPWHPIQGGGHGDEGHWLNHRGSVWEGRARNIRGAST